MERAWQLLLRRFERAPIKRRWFQVTGFLSNVIAILPELEWKPFTATHWINDLEDTWTFDLSKTFDLVPIVTDIERASIRYFRRAGFTTSARRKSGCFSTRSHGVAQTSPQSQQEVFLREPLCCSWRLAEVYGLSKGATKPSIPHQRPIS